MFTHFLWCLFGVVTWTAGFVAGSRRAVWRSSGITYRDPEVKPPVDPTILTDNLPIAAATETQRSWILKFRWGPNTVALLAKSPGNKLSLLLPWSYQGGPVHHRCRFETIIGPKGWLEAMRTVFNEPTPFRRDIYVRAQEGGETIVIQRPCLVSYTHSVAMNDEITCWHNVLFTTHAETVTFEKEPAII